MVAEKTVMMRKLSYYCKITSLVLTLSVPSFVHAEIMNMQINDLILKAIDTHPLIGSAMSEQKATQEGVKAAKRNLLPTPSVSSAYRQKGDLKSQISIRQPMIKLPLSMFLNSKIKWQRTP